MNTSKEIADWILSKTNWHAGDTISPLKLQKLLYYCQAWHCAIFGKPLFAEKIEAWAHGPVEPSQYHRFRDIPAYSNIDIHDVEIAVPVLCDKTEELLNEVMSIYGEHSASYLECLTHSERPWKQTRGNLPPEAASNCEIPVELMTEFYTSINCRG
jgi:uncharacterized phage-associated protein